MPYSRDLLFYILARFFSVLSYQIFILMISQTVYLKTENALNLGYIGLILFVPKVVFVFISGHAADRFNRQRLVYYLRFAKAAALFTILLGLTFLEQPLWSIYLLIFVLGTLSAFDGPANQALITELVKDSELHRAVSLNASVFQLGLALGPTLAGFLLYTLNNALVLSVSIALMTLSGLLIFILKPNAARAETAELSLKTLGAGLSYVRKNRVLFGAISLDLFAVLLGGSVALLPIFIKDVFQMDSWALGLLRAGPGFGAVLTMLFLARSKPFERAGHTLLIAVGIFGLATIGFGLSKSFPVSLVLLIVLGAADMISVVTRGVLVQVRTPPEMRGRVNAVHLVFVGASNELGEFESGLTAHWFGAAQAVIIGGVGTLLVVLVWAWLFPELRKLRRIEE